MTRIALKRRWRYYSRWYKRIDWAEVMRIILFCAVMVEILLIAIILQQIYG